MVHGKEYAPIHILATVVKFSKGVKKNSLNKEKNENRFKRARMFRRNCTAGPVYFSRVPPTECA